MLNLKELTMKRDNIAIATYNEYKKEGGQCCATCEHYSTGYAMPDLAGVESPNPHCELHHNNFDASKIYEYKCVGYRQLFRYKRAIKRIQRRSLKS